MTELHADAPVDQRPTALGSPKKKHDLKLALAIGLGCVVNPVNATMIAVAFSDIARSFGADLRDASWLVTLYLALTASLQPFAGAVGDRLGRRATFVAGMVAFALASAGAALAPSLVVLIVCRSAQAISSSFVIPNGIAILQDGVDPEHRGRAIGVLGAIMGLGAAIGLPLGGLLLSRGGWPLIFWVNLPLCAIGLAAAWTWIPRGGAARRELSPVAVTGAALLPLAVGLELFHRPPTRSIGAIGLGLAGATFAGGVLFVRRSGTARADLRALATRPMLGCMAFIALQQFVFFTVLLMLPAWLTTALGLPEGRAGMYVGVMTLLMVLLAPTSGRVSDAIGVRAPAVFGALCAAAGLAVLGASSASLPSWRAWAGMLLVGLGFGAAGPSVQRAVLDEAPPRAAGLAVGLFTSARYLGGIVGAAVLSASFAQRSVTVTLSQGIGIVRNVLAWGALPAVGAAWLLRSAAGGSAGGGGVDRGR